MTTIDETTKISLGLVLLVGAGLMALAVTMYQSNKTATNDIPHIDSQVKQLQLDVTSIRQDVAIILNQLQLK